MSDDNPSCKRQITVEPRVPDSSAVSLDADLEISNIGFLRYRTNLVQGSLKAEKASLNNLRAGWDYPRESLRWRHQFPVSSLEEW